MVGGRIQPQMHMHLPLLMLQRRLVRGPKRGLAPSHLDHFLRSVVGRVPSRVFPHFHQHSRLPLYPTQTLYAGPSVVTEASVRSISDYISSLAQGFSSDRAKGILVCGVFKIMFQFRKHISPLNQNVWQLAPACVNSAENSRNVILERSL
jgi:hypothetical protein